MFSGQSLAGRETDHKKNVEHVTKLADSLLGWRLGLAEPSPCVVECQAEPTAGSIGNKLGKPTTVDFDGDEHAKFGNVSWKTGLYNCNRRRR